MSDHDHIDSGNASGSDPLLELHNLDGIGESVELQCLVQEHIEASTYGNTSDHCLTQFDSILCWPRTARGTLAVLQCMDELQGIHYDSSSKCKKINNPGKFPFDLLHLYTMKFNNRTQEFYN